MKQPADKQRDNSSCAAEAPRAALFRVERLAVQYGERLALEDVTLAIPRGGITALMGPSGCGKTSFLNCLNRLTDLLPGCRVRGTVCLGETDIHGPGVDVVQLRRRVGMIFQKPNPFPLSIRRNLDLPLREHGVRSRQEREAILAAALRDVGLWDEVCDRLDAPALQLSGGQQQRLCIARALALEPEVLLMDEPCSALDPLASAVIEERIASFRQRLTVVIVTHNLSQARRLADDVALFWTKNGAGRLIEHGPSEQLFHHPRDPLTEAYVNGRTG